jgi:glycosyltransferase involved in cell wall biosynthesis
MLSDVSSGLPTVAIATRIYLPESGAAPYRLAALVSALNRSGYATTVFTSQVPSHVASTRGVRRFPVLRDKSGAVRGYLQYASFDIPLFFRLLFSRRYDAVVVEPPPTTGFVVRIACWLKRMRYVYFAADLSSVAAAGIGVNRFVVAILRRCESWVMRGAALVLSVSDAEKEVIGGFGVNPAKVVVIGTGVDTDLYRRDGTIATVNDPYFVYAGTMSEIQGAGIFIEAFARLRETHPRAQLLFFGHGTEEESLKAHAVQVAADRISFHGAVEAAEVATWFRGAVAGLASMAPSRGYDFAFSTKAFASLSCGTPVIYAGSGVSGELIREHSLGWCVEWDAAQVAEAMRAALDNQVSDSQRQRYSAWVLEHYSLSRVGQNAVDAVGRSLTD